MWKVFEWLFRAWDSSNKVAEKGMRSEKVNDAVFEIKKETLNEAEGIKISKKRNRLADEFFGDLQGHPELSVIDKVNFECVGMDEEDRLILIKILTDRLNEDPVYIRKKAKLKQ